MEPVQAATVGLPHVRQLACLRRQRFCLKGTLKSDEFSYYASSLDPEVLQPRSFAHKIRNHWSIENGSHHVRDCTYDEDRCMIRPHGAARILAASRQFAISLKQRWGFPYMPKFHQSVASKPSRAIQLIMK